MAEDRKPFEFDITDVVFQALGAASMCWDPRPSNQVFENQEAKDIGDKVIEWIEANYRKNAQLPVDWPEKEPKIGWEQFARNWLETAQHEAINNEYWRERCQAAEGKLDRIKALTERDNG
jgi:hypothetical protein